MLNLKNAPKTFTVDEEIKRILKRYPEANFDSLSEILDRQFQLLQARGYALLVICGLLVTGNALVGSLFQRPQAAVTPLIIAFRLGGGAFAVGAAAVVLLGVLRLKWITQYPGDTLEEWLEYAIRFRNAKTRAFRHATILALISIVLYECSIASYVMEHVNPLD